MAAPKITKGTWVRVDWDDACSEPSTDWMTEAEARKNTKVAKVRSVGYVISATPKQVKLAQNVGIPQGDVCHIIAIPTAWITKVEELP